jgi:hypothetical protein
MNLTEETLTQLQFLEMSMMIVVDHQMLQLFFKQSLHHHGIYVKVPA